MAETNPGDNRERVQVLINRLAEIAMANPEAILAGVDFGQAASRKYNSSALSPIRVIGLDENWTPERTEGGSLNDAYNIGALGGVITHRADHPDEIDS